MRIIFLFVLYISLFIFYTNFSIDVVYASNSYIPVNIDTISNLSLHDDYQNFPLGQITFANIPFNIPTSGNNFLATHNVACASCPKSGVLTNLSIDDPVNIWVIVNASDAFIRFDGQNYASMKLFFSDQTTFTYDFIIGQNVREWLQSGNYGETVNTLNSQDSVEVWKGYRPNGEFPVIADLLKIEVPSEHRSKTIVAIGFYDESISRVTVSNPMDPGLILKGVTVESSQLNFQDISLHPNWPVGNDQLPIDRDLAIVARVTKGSTGVSGVNVSAEVISGDGEFVETNVMTDSHGSARFVLKPNATGNLEVRFSDGTTVKDLSYNVYRPPVVIVPGHGASFSGKEMLLGVTDPSWHWFTQYSLNSWDEILQVLEANGYVENSDYKIVFYDWRKSLRGSAPEARERFLKPAIQDLLEGKPAGQKVNILAHSFGGLVSRSLIEQSPAADSVSRFITFGTPHYGSANAYYAWEGGTAAPNGDAVYRSTVFALTHLMKKTFNFPNRAQVVRALIPSVQELLPIFSPYLYNNGSIDTFSLLVGLNPLLDSDLNIITFVDRLPSYHIEYDNVIGASHDTIGTIHVSPSNENTIWEDGKPTGTKGIVLGDGTIDAQYALLGAPFDTYSQAVHGDLPDGTRALVTQKLKLSPFAPPVKEMPKTFFTVLLLSPADAEIFNSAGTKVSEKFDLEDEEHSLVYIADPADDTYTVKVTGTGNGTYELFANLADAHVYDELTLERSIKLGEVQEIPITIDNHDMNITQTIPTTFKWTPGQISIRKFIPYSQLEVMLPAAFPVNQLSTDFIAINGQAISVNKHTVTKRNKSIKFDVKTSDLLRALRNRTGSTSMNILVKGSTHTLSATHSFVIPTSLRKWMTL